MNVFLSLFPYSVWECWWLAPAALFLDLWLGDPALPWRHPVCYAGGLLNILEKPARRFMEKADESEAEAGTADLAAAIAARQRVRGRLAGLVVLVLVLAVTGGTVSVLVSLPYAGSVLALYLAWAGLALKSLLDTGREVLKRVEARPEAEGRKALSWLVSRETGSMDKPLMRKTLADTLSENFTDALLVPYFWLLLSGPVGLWLYKAVSTTDSMWGYLTPRWRWLGWAGARADDALAFVPARLSVLVLQATDALCRLGPGRQKPWQGRWPGLGVVARQAAGMPSPNSGWPMTACAWLCGARMAGPSVYFGSVVTKPWLGPDAAEAGHWDAARLLALCTLLRYAGILGGLLLWAVCTALVVLLSVVS